MTFYMGGRGFAISSMYDSPNFVNLVLNDNYL